MSWKSSLNNEYEYKLLNVTFYLYKKSLSMVLYLAGQLEMYYNFINSTKQSRYVVLYDTLFSNLFQLLSDVVWICSDHWNTQYAATVKLLCVAIILIKQTRQKYFATSHHLYLLHDSVPMLPVQVGVGTWYPLSFVLIVHFSAPDCWLEYIRFIRHHMVDGSSNNIYCIHR